MLHTYQTDAKGFYLLDGEIQLFIDKHYDVVELTHRSYNQREQLPRSSAILHFAVLYST